MITFTVRLSHQNVLLPHLDDRLPPWVVHLLGACLPLRRPNVHGVGAEGLLQGWRWSNDGQRGACRS